MLVTEWWGPRGDAKDSSRLAVPGHPPAQAPLEPLPAEASALPREFGNRQRMELLGKMIFASDFERLLTRFCLCWRFIWGLLFPCRSIRRAGSLHPCVQLSHSPLAADSSHTVREKAFG